MLISLLSTTVVSALIARGPIVEGEGLGQDVSLPAARRDTG